MVNEFSSYLSNPEIISLTAEKIKQLRIERRMTQRELSERAGLYVKTIKRLENGKSVGFSTFIAVIRSLGLIENLNFLIPKQEPTIESLKEIKKIVPIRQRVRRSG